MPLTLDHDFLAAALIGYQEKLKQIEGHIAELSYRLRVESSAPPVAAAAPAARKRTLSAEGRAHIIAALKKKWSAVRKAKVAAVAKTAPKPAGKPKTAAKRTVVKKALVKKATGARLKVPAPVPVPAAVPETPAEAEPVEVTE